MSTLREQVARALFEAGPSHRLFNSIPPVYYDFADAALAVVAVTLPEPRDPYDYPPGHAAGWNAALDAVLARLS